MNLQKYNKAYVPVIVGAVLWGLSHYGITPQMSVQDLVGYVVGSAAVWAVPNKLA